LTVKKRIFNTFPTHCLRYSLLSLLMFTFCLKQQVGERTSVLRLNICTEPPTLDPRKAGDATSLNVLLGLFEGLTRIAPDHQPHPALAEKIEISEDGCTYIFRLREAYWSNGERITSEDFFQSWKTILNPSFPSPLANKFYIIKKAKAIKENTLPVDHLGVQAPSPDTLIVHLNHPAPYFLELTSFPIFFAVYRGNLSENQKDWAEDAGSNYIVSGPFSLKTWEHETEIQLVKNPYYWDSDSVLMNTILLSMIDDHTTEFYLFEREELDWCGSPLSSLPTDFIPFLKNEGGLHSYGVSAVYYYKLNIDRFPCNNRNIRKALGYSIRRKDIIQHILQSDQSPATGMIPPTTGWPNPSSFFMDASENLAKEYFQKGMEELGLSLENFPTLVLSFNKNHEHQKIAEVIQQQWKENLGIEVELENCDWKSFLSKIGMRDYQIARSPWICDFSDPTAFLEPFKFKDDSLGFSNGTGWENSEYIFLLDKATFVSEEKKRKELLQRAEKILIEEMPVIPLYFIVYHYLKKPYVHDIYLSPLGMMDLKYARLERIN
jgi:oligopeptide transport system substrate-binding protein